ncbi:hypothetical protein G6M04_31435 [Agrobacterium rhizogenes]|uniref:YrhB domain-containing protein n=1 Tax=Rhizobium rhizogenes TaxID=359 RepID=UPI0015733F38|nr:YrhB domain-containing protein [Rhizobium rhizogenes]NTG51895.1 hypothetical protein [Rhizobium rhizogenes]
MIDLKQAECSAIEYVETKQKKLGIPLQIVRRLDVPYGWVFFYNTQAYVQTGEIISALAGNAPFIIDADNGSLHVFGTAFSIDRYLQEYESLREGYDAKRTV